MKAIDINKNANGDNDWSPIPINGQAKKNGAIDPADPIYSIGTGEHAHKIYSVRNADGGGLKTKFFAKTNSLGITQDDKLNRTFAWGVVGGIGLILGLKYVQNKGYLKSFKFLKKI